MTPMQLRVWIKNHPHTLFSNATVQHSDIMDPKKTKDSLISMIADLIKKGHIMYFTAINSDHHDDSGLGLHCHHNGYAFDCWPMNSTTAGDWIDASDVKFQQFLKDASIDPKYYQIGLAGTAWTHADVVVAGGGVFHDDGADHVHVGVK